MMEQSVASFELAQIKKDIQLAGPTVLFLRADWCGACGVAEAVLPQIEGIKRMHVIDVDHPDVVADSFCATYDVQNVPTTLIFHKGEKVGHIIGVGVSEDSYAERMKETLSNVRRRKN